MITPVTILMAIALMFYALRGRSQPAKEPVKEKEYIGNYLFYRVNLNDEQPLYLDGAGIGKLTIYKSSRSFAFHANDKLIYYRSNYTSTMNEELEESFSFTDGKATCYWKQQRLVLYINLTDDGTHGNQYELDFSEAT
ncbi:hypothetical protein [Mucilaginibacter sp. PAMB04168]|uniref:hypothetical protein n=1 Tax=Mucilaginibacter sp. PAMB04168 TaxID=3138567 RepID=UPI0031F6BD4F